LASGVIDALVSDHNPVAGDMKVLPFAQAEPGASGVELLLSLTLKWILEMDLAVVDGLRVVTATPGGILSQGVGVGASAQPKLGRLAVGGAADFCLFDPHEVWSVNAQSLISQGKHTPFDFEMNGSAMTGRVKSTWVQGRRVYARA
jgi:dihydroorotase